MSREPGMEDGAGMPSVGAHVSLGPGREFDLVRLMLDRWGLAARGVGDDAAVLDVPRGQRLVVSVDTSTENVHFRAEWLTPREIGYRATMAAMSDLAAMAAEPLGVLVALSLPARWEAHLAALADGVGEAVACVGGVVFGGDLGAGTELALAVTALGTAARPVTRSGARPGDSVYVTGVLGGPGAALRAWASGDAPDAWARRRFARPSARIREARWLAEHGATSMIDVSDGLSSELWHLATASAVELRIDVEQVPAGHGIAWRHAMTSGEEYELLLTASDELDVDAFARTFAVPLSRLGSVRVAERPLVTARENGQRVDLAPGHDHFSR